jgi:hypothetical protein
VLVVLLIALVIAIAHSAATNINGLTNNLGS